MVKSKKPDFITGHSLGAFLAEVACSKTGKVGASFAAPPSFSPLSSFACDGKHVGVKWKTVINKNDPVPNLIGKHIAKGSDIWVLDFFEGNPHAIVTYYNKVGKLDWVWWKNSKIYIYSMWFFK